MASGYLIVTRFEVLYDTALHSGMCDDHPIAGEPIYGIPHRNRPIPPQDMPQYRGVDRKPLQPLSFANARLFTEMGTPCEANEATALLDEIASATGRDDGWVTAPKDILKVWNTLGDGQRRYEIIFGKEWEDGTKPSPNAQFLGYDAAYFGPDHFSCVCDTLFMPRWHGADPEGVLFKEHFRRLNRDGLFGTSAEALNFLQYYLSFDWTEREDKMTSIEVYAVRAAAL
jgi:hypothetical protein